MPGDVGNQGDQGPAGLIGVIGYAGPQGEKGTMGDKVGAATVKTQLETLFIINKKRQSLYHTIESFYKRNQCHQLSTLDYRLFLK
jgi:hypothetical protein